MSSSSGTQFGRTVWALALGGPGRVLSRSTAARQFFTFRPIPPFRNASTYTVRRSCTSGGLLLLGLGHPVSSTQNAVSSCTTAADSAVVASRRSPGGVRRLAWQAWARGIHSTAQRRSQKSKNTQTRQEGEAAEGKTVGKSSQTQTKADTQRPAEATAPKSTGKIPGQQETLTDSVSKYLHLRPLPKIPHRPTKEELLAAANGFWQRLRVRFKWFSIRSLRPYNADEWGAFVSWILVGHFVWILVGTTTFLSLIIFLVNTVFAQETLAKWVGDALTEAAGVTVVFESAIVPRWRDGVITFRNVFVSRRPGQVQSSVTKGSSTDAAAAAAAAQPGHDPEHDVDDGNYTQYDLTINEVNITVSFAKWWNSKGLLKDVEVKGVRGVVDRTSVFATEPLTDPLSYRHVYQPGDFEIEHFKLEDLLVTVHQPGGFRPFSVSIYSCELPQLRKQWIFYDFLSASHMSGSFDGSLFTIHPKQVHGVHAGDDRHMNENLGEPSAWKKFSRLRIDGIKIDHLNRGVEGTFGWIYEGTVDIVADVMFPAEPDESLGKVMSDFYDKMEEAVTSNRYLRILEADGGQRRDFTNLDEAPLGPPRVAEDLEEADVQEAPSDHLPEPGDNPEGEPTEKAPEELPRYLVMDLRLHLNDVRAAVPMFRSTPDISYINQTLIRPIVAYINAKHTYIPIACRIVKRHADFDGSWSMYDCGLMDDMSAEVYAAFAHDVEDQHSRVKRLKKVGFWAFSVALQALLVGVAGDLIS